MPEQDKRVVRATLRCLRQDLAQEVGPDDLKVALRTVVDDMAADPTYLLPCRLVDAEHAESDWVSRRLDRLVSQAAVA